VGLYLAYGSKELNDDSRMELSLLLVCVTFGMSLMAISTNLLMLYLGVETVSIVSFVMAGFRRENLRSNEASFKYLVYGSLASGLMLYGMSLIYGFAGSLYYTDLSTYFAQNAAQLPYTLGLALLLLYAGLAYKVSAFPLHFWTPDVYEGAPTPVAAFFSVGPKAAGFAAVLRLFLDVFSVKTGPGQWHAIEGLALPHAFAVISALTMLVGNLSAIGQTNVKRMLAYSSIAHVGYMLAALVALNGASLTAILFYIIAYCGMNLGAFWVVGVVSDLRGNEDLEAFRGIGWKMPLLGVCMGVFLFSLTGLPLFSGFVGKFLLFGAILQAPGYMWLALFGVLNSVVSLYYYVRVLKSMWLDKPLAGDAGAVALPLYHAVPLLGLAIPTIILGLFFAPVFEFAQRSVAAFLN
jgi:NADH-quinone oxidoreductase subunit N